MINDSNLWSKLVNDTSFEDILYAILRHTARRLSDLAQRPLMLNKLKINTLTISDLMLTGSNPEAETVAVYLRLSKDLPGEAILMFSPDDAMYLIDWLLEMRPGSTTQLDDLGRSALAETGNLAVSAFLNGVAEYLGRPLAPSPPTVRVDMLATILEAGVTPMAGLYDTLLTIETDFVNFDSELVIKMWIVPRVSIATNGQLTTFGENQG